MSEQPNPLGRLFGMFRWPKPPEQQPPMVTEVKEDSNSLKRVLKLMEKKTSNLGELGHALLDLSRELITGWGSPEQVDRLRSQWRAQTVNGTKTDGLVGEVENFQRNIESIMALRPQGESDEAIEAHTFYLPGSGGYARVTFYFDHSGKPQADLVDYPHQDVVKKKFARLQESI